MFDTPSHFTVIYSLCRTLREIRAAIPPHLFIRDTSRGLFYLARDVFMAVAIWSLVSLFDTYFQRVAIRELLTPAGAELFRWFVWSA